MKYGLKILLDSHASAILRVIGLKYFEIEFGQLFTEEILDSQL
jgi:hypothetical protein